MPNMPIAAVYRSAGVHAFQDEGRIREIVIPEIDRVHAIDAESDLLMWAANVARSPESRLLAAERLLRPAEQASAGRRKSSIDAARVRALVCGLSSLERAHPLCYASLFDPTPPPAEGPQPAPRPAEHAEALRTALAALRAA